MISIITAFDRSIKLDNSKQLTVTWSHWCNTKEHI